LHTIRWWKRFFLSFPFPYITPVQPSQGCHRATACDLAVFRHRFESGLFARDIFFYFPIQINVIIVLREFRAIYRIRLSRCRRNARKRFKKIS
jgi:hypothetical protein